MMQSILVIVIVVLAAGYLVRAGYKRFIVKDSACDSCAMGSAAMNNSSEE